MKTLTKNFVSLYIFDDSVPVTVGIDSTIVGGTSPFVIGDCTSSNSVLATVTQAPDDWAGGKYLYTGAWEINPSYVDLFPVPVPPKVSPVEFMLLFKSSERVAIKARRATDPVIDDWLDIIEDPRLTHVDLALQSTQDALAYLVSLDIITDERKGEILGGEIQ